MNHQPITLRVWGDYACFTRPEMKVERVSYQVMTPSAARGILEAVFWEPQMYYLIDSIRVVRRGQWFSFRRNEVTEVVRLSKVRQWMQAPERIEPLIAGAGTKICAPRSMLGLVGVEYLITAELHLTERSEQPRHNWQTYYDELTRRAQRGKCFHRPCLGVREFAADFEWESDPDVALRRRADELGAEWRAYEDDLGLMLYDVFDEQHRARGGKVAAGATFFEAHVRESFMDCHPLRVNIVRKTTKGN